MSGIIYALHSKVKKSIMKKILSILGMSAMIFATTSCNNDDNDPVLEPSIVGTWQPTTLKISGVANGQNFTQTMSANECQLKSRAIYNENGTGVYNVWDDSEGTCVQQPANDFTYNYNRDTKVITITDNGTSQSGTVTTLNATTLTFSVASTYDYQGQNVPVTMEISANRIR